MQITPIGAAGGVTGSLFLVEAAGGRYVVDCGMFQGRDEDESRNYRFPFEPESIDAVFLTHAHLDHCGRLPFLHARGFRGPVYATASTCELAQFIMLDAAKLQQEDADRRNRRLRRAGQEATRPLYDEQDVLHLLKYFKPVPYREPLVHGGVTATFRQSGHILGSAGIALSADGVTAFFSGDLGSPGRNVVPDPDPAPDVDLIFCESTYGDRLHRTEEESVQELAEAVNWAYDAGGNVVIPSFALERTQDILFQLHELRRKGLAPKNPVYVDSPLATNLTRVYEQHPQDLDDETRAFFTQREDPLPFPRPDHRHQPGAVTRPQRPRAHRHHRRQRHVQRRPGWCTTSSTTSGARTARSSSSASRPPAHWAAASSTTRPTCRSIANPLSCAQKPSPSTAFPPMPTRPRCSSGCPPAAAPTSP